MFWKYAFLYLLLVKRELVAFAPIVKIECNFLGTYYLHVFVCFTRMDNWKRQNLGYWLRLHICPRTFTVDLGLRATIDQTLRCVSHETDLQYLHLPSPALHVSVTWVDDAGSCLSALLHPWKILINVLVATWAGGSAVLTLKQDVSPMLSMVHNGNINCAGYFKPTLIQL